MALLPASPLPDARGTVVGRTSGIRLALHLATRFAPNAGPILILGERGTGKSRFARELHRMSSRRGEFVVCQLDAGPKELQYSELFGHRRGAFTGADADRSGKVASAAGGTLFLDELALADPETQGLLLALFNRDAVYRLGEDRPLPVTARIIGASNVDLDELAKQGQFRRDLLDRFGCQRIWMPPLRERRDEILPLFVNVWSRERPGEGSPSFDTPSREALLAAVWPGNLRELENVAVYAAAMAELGGPITTDLFPPQFFDPANRPGSGNHPSADEVQAAIHRAHGNKSAAARMLGISRRTIQRQTNVRKV